MTLRPRAGTQARATARSKQLPTLTFPSLHLVTGAVRLMNKHLTWRRMKERTQRQRPMPPRKCRGIQRRAVLRVNLAAFHCTTASTVRTARPLTHRSCLTVGASLTSTLPLTPSTSHASTCPLHMCQNRNARQNQDQIATYTAHAALSLVKKTRM